MRLEGSCHCGAVKFTVESPHPYPFNLCYCSICRKTAGGGGYAINLSADHRTMKIVGKQHLRSYNARMSGADEESEVRSAASRNFCGRCGSALWLWDPRWPDLVHPHASCIDTELPAPPEHTHLMLASKAPWVKACIASDDRTFDGYPDESIAEWHQRLGVES